jgi:hypothetical protein
MDAKVRGGRKVRKQMSFAAMEGWRLNPLLAARGHQARLRGL